MNQNIMQKAKMVVPYIVVLLLGMALYAGYSWIKNLQDRVIKAEVLSSVAADYLNAASKGDFGNYLNAAMGKPTTQRPQTQEPASENTNQPTE